MFYGNLVVVMILHTLLNSVESYLTICKHYAVLECFFWFHIILASRGAGAQCASKREWFVALEDMQDLFKFIFLFPWFGIEAKRGVEFRFSTCNASRIYWKVGNGESILCFLCLPCYVQDTAWSWFFLNIILAMSTEMSTWNILKLHFCLSWIWLYTFFMERKR